MPSDQRVEYTPRPPEKPQRCIVLGLYNLSREDTDLEAAYSLARLAKLDGMAFSLPCNAAAPRLLEQLAAREHTLPFCIGFTEMPEEVGSYAETVHPTLNHLLTLPGYIHHEAKPVVLCLATSAEAYETHKSFLSSFRSVQCDRCEAPTAPTNSQSSTDYLATLKRELLSAVQTTQEGIVVTPPLAGHQYTINTPRMYGAYLRFIRGSTLAFVAISNWREFATCCHRESDPHALRIIEESARSTWAPPPLQPRNEALGEFLREIGRLSTPPAETQITTAPPFQGRKRWIHSLSNVIRSAPLVHKPLQKAYHSFRSLKKSRLLSSGTLESPYARPLPLRFEVDRRSQAEIAVVVHAFYADLLEDLKAALLHIHEPFDIYVTTPHRADVSSIKNALRDLTPHVVIVTTENRGRDIGPFIALFRAHTFTPYRAVLKVHLKKSLYSAKGDLWRSSLFNQLCSDVIRVDKILAHLGSSRVGIIGPHAFFLANPRYWGANRPMVVSLRRAIGMHIPERESLGFFAGSMFWFTPAALRDIHKLPEALLAFEPEEGLQDGTLAHAYERTFTDMAYNAGFIASSPELNGADITEFSEVLSNSVPVL